MKRCWMLLICMGIAACTTTEALETSTETQAIYTGPPVAKPTLKVFKGWLPTASDSQVWVITRSHLTAKEYLAVLVETEGTGSIVAAYRVPMANMSDFTSLIGKMGAGFLRPIGVPPPPPDVWPTWFVAAAFRFLELPNLAVLDAYNVHQYQ